MKTAKHKLNSAHLLGSLVIAGLFGWLTGSLTVFVIVLVALVATAIHSGEIRA